MIAATGFQLMGIGVDILDIRRIQKSYDLFGDRFLNRIFTPYEQSYCSSKTKAINSFSKIFAAKEAVLKAIGNTDGISWKDIEVNHMKTGKPFIILHGTALKNFQNGIAASFHFDEKPSDFQPNIQLSLSDEPPYVIAYVIMGIDS